jgi:hypothetical protein
MCRRVLRRRSGVLRLTYETLIGVGIGYHYSASRTLIMNGLSEFFILIQSRNKPER